MSTSRRWEVSPLLRQCLVSLSVGCTTVGHGCVAALSAVLLTQLREIHGTTITMDHISWTASILSPTLTIGGFLVSPVMGRLGRKVAHLAVTVPGILAWLMIAFANTFTLIMIGRVLQGISYGMMMSLRSILIGEYTSPKYRGAFLASVSLAQGSGALVVHLIGAFLHWRTTCLLCSLFHVASLIIIYFTPESPSWLADKDKFEQCKKAFKLLRGDEDNMELDKLIRAKTTVYDTEKVKNISDVLGVIKKKEFYKPIVLMLHVYATSELSSVSIMVIYPTTVLSLVVSPNIDLKLWTLMLDINRVLSCVFFIYITKKIRRKTLMVSSSSICIVSYIVMAGCMYIRRFGILSDNVWLPLVIVNVAYVSMVSVQGTPYIIAGEIFPLQYKSIGSSISVVFLTPVFFAVVKTFPDLISAVGLGYTYLIYAGFLTYCSIVISLYLPETKGKTLLQIEEEFRGKSVDEIAMENDQTLTSINPSEKLLETQSDHNIEENSRLSPKI